MLLCASLCPEMVTSDQKIRVFSACTINSASFAQVLFGYNSVVIYSGWCTPADMERA